MHGLPYYLVGGTESLFNGIDIEDVQTAFVDKIQSYLPDNPVIWISLSDVRKGLAHQVHLAKELLGNDLFVITLSELYFAEAEDQVSCTRVVDRHYQKLGISNRPGTVNLKSQVQQLMAKIGNRPVAVVDDTLFHGETIELLQQLGLRVNAAVEFFTAIKATEALDSQGVSVFSAHTLDGYLDVMPLHDFLPGMPLCGKLVGEQTEEGIDHLGYEDGISWSYPYIYPYIPPALVTDWASIPWDFAHDFSAFSLQQATIIAERLKLQGIVTIQDISNAQPHHVSIPCLNCMEENQNPSLHDILRRAVHRCMA